MRFLRNYRLAALVLGLLAACMPGNTIGASPLIRRYRVTSRGSGPRSRRRKGALRLIATLANGALVFSTYDKDTPATFTDANEVIAGIEEGVTGIKVDERRNLILTYRLK